MSSTSGPDHRHGERTAADRRVTAGIASSVIRVDGKLPIKELAVLLRHARLLISNSTGRFIWRLPWAPK
jgi:ADP-heptose:LPS heptosyltransferase